LFYCALNRREENDNSAKEFKPDFQQKIRMRTDTLKIKQPLLIRQAAVSKGIVSPDWKGLQMVSLDRFEV
jgi:hypothetical protein